MLVTHRRTFGCVGRMAAFWAATGSSTSSKNHVVARFSDRCTTRSEPPAVATQNIGPIDGGLGHDVAVVAIW